MILRILVVNHRLVLLLLNHGVILQVGVVKAGVVTAAVEVVTSLCPFAGLGWLMRSDGRLWCLGSRRSCWRKTHRMVANGECVIFAKLIQRRRDFDADAIVVVLGVSTSSETSCSKTEEHGADELSE